MLSRAQKSDTKYTYQILEKEKTLTLIYEDKFGILQFKRSTEYLYRLL